ncbi:RimJ/RimL family protein N-acetyltransferase [Paenibacillus anaericanus]|uniref:GNAT family N-acetyltransferase n=1 Tax=Paenibacillus anaericanus TaxID=170367 RepID=UPI00278A3A70|nr:GNAT family N-acetyltransferase [Paenibacillus anaericanus]MDQ0092020.1 RimJ/RimL family protein N-acetyltransferase [Paenibacillus anaericanus]
MIESDVLKFRKTEVIDLTFVLNAETDSENTPFIGQWTVEQHLESLTNEDIHHLIIENKNGDKVGYVILTGLLDSNKVICIKRITIQMKNKGYGKESLKLIINWIFEETEAHRLWLDVKEFNTRARHVYESVGFIFEGTLRDCIFKGNKFESISVMSILRHEYKSNLLFNSYR